MPVLTLLRVLLAPWRAREAGLRENQNPAAMEMVVNMHGLGAGGLLLENVHGQVWIAGLVLTALAAVGFATSLRLPKVPASGTSERATAALGGAWRAVRSDRRLWLATLGQIAFWSIASLLGQDVLDMRALFESGVFDPELSRYDDLTEVSALLLGDPSGRELEALDGDARYELVHKARAPRVRSTTRDKITAQVTEALNWQAERLYALYDAFCTEEDREAARRADAEADRQEADRQEADRQEAGRQDAEPDAPQQLPE